MNYYYLISSLPTIPRDYQVNGSIDLPEIFDMIERNLTEEDREYYYAMLYQNDNRNLLNLIFAEYHDFRGEYFYQPSVLTIEELRAYRRNRSALPGYMIDFLVDNSGVFGSYSLTDIEVKFRRYFIEYLDQLNCDFVKRYYQWQQKLKSIVAEVNQSSYTAMNRADVLLYDFGVSRNPYSTDYKQLKNELKDLIQSQDYVALERKIDRLYWDFAASHSGIFTIEAVLAYVALLLRLSRWLRLTPEDHQNAFEKLVDDLKKMDRSPKMNVV
jgi:hypothetical protein